MSKKAAAEILSALMEVYDKALTVPAQDLYVQALESENEELLRQAAARAISTLKYFPRVSELKSFVSAIKDEIEQENTWKYHADKAKAAGARTSPWVKMSSWELRSQRVIAPVVLSWHTCPVCRQRYANWDTCPVCSLAEVKV